jgi:hypothetical protein
VATEDIRNVARDLRQLAREVGSRSDAEAGSLDAERLRHLGELLLIAADMACDIAGDSPGGKELSAEIADELFEDILYREFPDGPGPAAAI